MNQNDGLDLVAPGITPSLDPAFRPAVLANHHFRSLVAQSGNGVPVRIALEQSDGNVSHLSTHVLAQDDPASAGNVRYIERLLKFLLWSRGGYRIYIDGPKPLRDAIAAHYHDTAIGKFDSEIVAQRMFDNPLEVVATSNQPPERTRAASLGRHLEGCRIGFDLGGSDRKVAAVIDGKVVFSEEVVWDPYFQPDPEYHYAGIADSLRKASAHLPRVDAIGGSAAGIYVNNRVKVASLFRGVPHELFQTRVRDIFLRIRKEWNDIPFDVVNDGEVTALAGSMSLGKNCVLGISLGTSTAGGFVNREGNITSWLNELAFVPVDYNPAAARDEWSGDYGCGVQYFSQQAVARLIPVAGIQLDPSLPFAERLKAVQALMLKDDYRARKIFETIGTYLGYTVAHFWDFYDLENVLILGRVTSGTGGDIIIEGARAVLKAEFPEIAARVAFHIPDEKDKRHGQAIAAASLPALEKP